MDFISKLPDAVLIHSLQFAADSASVVFGWRTVSSHFERVVRHPTAVSYVPFVFKTWEDVRLIGPQARGVRTASQRAGMVYGMLEAMSAMPCLRVLSLTNFWTDSVDFESALAPLQNLETFNLCDIHYLDILRLPQSVSRAKVQNCTNLKRLYGSPTLRDLTVNYCCRLASISNIPELLSLTLHGCKLEPYQEARTIRKLNTTCFVPARPHSLSQCTALEEISLYSECVPDLDWIAPLTRLKSLLIWHCDALQNLAGVSRLGLLTCVKMSGRRLNDESLSSLAHLSQLRLLEIESDLITDEGLRAVGKLFELRQLHLNGCRLSQQGLEHLRSCSVLAALYLTRTFLITDLGPLSSFAKLKVLSLSWLTHLESLAPLSKLESLASLTLEQCRSVSSLRDLASLPALDRLSLQDCCELTRKGLLELWPTRVTRIHICNMPYWFDEFEEHVPWSITKWNESEDHVL